MGGELDNAEAYFILNLLPGIGPSRVNQLLSLFGEPTAILAAGRKDLARVPGIGDGLASVLCNWHEHCDPGHERKLAERGGVTIVTRDHERYPYLLKHIYDPPLCLYVRGDMSALDRLRDSIAIVGSRRTTSYGVKTASNLATAASLAGWAVVSGLARGIDTAAHTATLQVQGCTVAVLGGGLAHIYPQENVDLARRIAADNGAVVSELPMTFRPDKRTFPMRNRVISGMTRGCIVVEAGHRSGSLITAGQALEQNRQVFAVPGRVDSAQSRGCHALIKDGAKLVENFQDVLEEFTALPGFEALPRPESEQVSGEAKSSESGGTSLNLSDLERKLMTFLDDGEEAIDDIIAALDEPPGKVIAALVTLEMRHIVRQLPGKRVVRHSGAVTS